MENTTANEHENHSCKEKKSAIKSFPILEEDFPEFKKAILSLELDSQAGMSLKILNAKDVADFWEGLIKDTSDGADKIRSFFRKTFENDLMAGSNMFKRKLVRARAPKCLNVLEREFPHFQRSGLISALKEDLVLSQLGDGVLSISPTLILSPPGFGKNRFIRRVAEILKVRVFRSFDFSSSTAGWALSGLNSSWSGAKPGFVFQTLTSNESPGNPLFFVDEVEKGSASTNASRPIDCLHALLEKETAISFLDEYCPIPINASQINWIAAANSLNGIPQSILSRFKIFEIPSPSPAEKKQITESIWSDLINQNIWGKYLFPKLNEDILTRFEVESPRIIQRILRSSAARALARTGGPPPKEKIQLSITDLIFDRMEDRQKRPVGFHVPGISN
jgi:ATP-dependent Lon protease